MMKDEVKDSLTELTDFDFEALRNNVVKFYDELKQGTDDELSRARELVFAEGEGASSKIAEGAKIIREYAEEDDSLEAWRLMLECHEKRIGPFKTNKFRRDSKAAIERLVALEEYYAEFADPSAPDRVWPDFSKLLKGDKDGKVLSDYDRLRPAMGDYTDSKCARLIDRKDIDEMSETLGVGRNARFDSENEMIIFYDTCEFLRRARGRIPAVFEYIRKKEKAGTVDDQEREMFACWKGFRYVVLKPLKQIPGFGVHCQDLLSNHELFVVDRSFSRLERVEQICLATGIFPFGGAFMTSGTGFPFPVEAVETMMAVMLATMGLSRPIELDREQRARFASTLIGLAFKSGIANRVTYK